MPLRFHNSCLPALMLSSWWSQATTTMLWRSGCCSTVNNSVRSTKARSTLRQRPLLCVASRYVPAVHHSLRSARSAGLRSHQNAHSLTPNRTSWWERGLGISTCKLPSRNLNTPAAAKRRQEIGPVDGCPSVNIELQQLGFSAAQASQLLNSYTVQQICGVDNVQQWLQLLQSFGVQHPIQVAAKFPIIFKSQTESVAANAAEVVQWMFEKGLTAEEVARVITTKPMILVIPHTTLEATDAWVQSKFEWSTSKVATLLARNSTLFCLSAVNNLAPKLAWLVSKGVRQERVGMTLYTTPALFNCSIEHFESQWSELLSMGFSELEVVEMVSKKLELLMRNFGGGVMRDKVRFLTLVMQRSVSALVVCPNFLKYDLYQRMGPRWSFFALHCPGQEFVISTNFNPPDEQFAERLRSSSLDAECRLRCISQLQLFLEHKVWWQKGEGLRWYRAEKHAGYTARAARPAQRA